MVTIIGAGPVGLTLAWRLAAQGENVTLVEEHNKIGAPVQCTGILTSEIEKYVPKKLLDSATMCKIERAVIHSPKDSVELKIKTDRVVDNVEYCQALKRLATKAGALVLTNTRYINNTKNHVHVRNLKTGKTSMWKENMLVGADGPSSSVAKINNMYSKREFLAGVQAVVRMKKGHYDDKIHFHPHIGEYAWYCPEGNGQARIGVAARKDARKTFDEYLSTYKCEVLSMQGGVIPLFCGRNAVVSGGRNAVSSRVQNAVVGSSVLFGKNLWSKNGRRKGGMEILLIGDAALQLKNSTGGGIVAGTKAAYALATARKKGDYEKNLRKLNKELEIHYLINKIMRKFSGKDWDKLIRQVNDKKVKQILAHIDRDNAVKMVIRLVIAKPSLILWARKLL